MSRRFEVGRVARAIAAVGAVLVIAAGSGACATASVSAPPAAPPAAPGMTVSNIRLEVGAPDGPISVNATITNVSSNPDALVGASSTVARIAGLYATSGCMPDPTPAVQPGCGAASGKVPAGKVESHYWRIEPGASLELRSGDGEILLIDLVHPVAYGQTIDITFKFQTSAAVTMQVPIP